MDGRKHSQFTGEPAKISRRAGGAFTCYGGYIKGFNLTVESPKLIVQAWRSRDWPKETYSIVTFKLTELPGGRTRLAFTQAGVPASDFKAKNEGWRTHYWEPLKRFLEEKKP
jgi:activator of HSP90 ATPase